MSAAKYLSETGALSKVLSGFAVRRQQREMADKVDRTIKDGGVLVAEAGTGVGKTFAYLVPAILSGKRTIIATGTRNLQDQLFHEDLPVVRDALGVPVTAALLKGRANYLCTHRLDMSRNAGGGGHRCQQELAIINDWSGRTASGDVAEVDDVEEGSFVWPLVTSTTENCVGQDCDDYAECYVLKARREAQAADIVVINHHLLFADMALKEQGFGDILPGADVFIIDEAHQLPEVAGNFFGDMVTSGQLRSLAVDTQTEHLQASGGLGELPDDLSKLEKSVADLRLSMGQAGRRLSWSELQCLRSFQGHLTAVQKSLSALQGWLSGASERSRGLDSCHKRATGLLERLSVMGAEPDEDAAVEIVHWADTSQHGFRLHSTPLDVAGIFQGHMAEMRASWVFTSATLTTGGSFEHFNGSLGLKTPATQAFGSPFPYENNGLTYIPKFSLNTDDPAYTRAVCEQSVRVIKAAQGRTFMLFTSHRALKVAAEFMAAHLHYPILVQGEAPKQRLLKDFKAYGNAVLLGTSSFWAGVDVRGSALSCVIIDKLPFASPGDPVMKARLSAMKKKGQSPFLEYQVPSAVVALKQGAGRLIRDVSDTGVLMLCDPRLLSKSYGRIFLSSIPPMPLARDIEDVERFFAANKAESA